MEDSRIQIIFGKSYLCILVIIAAIVYAIAGVQWGFLITSGILLVLTFAIVVVLKLKFGLILLLFSYFFVRPIYYLPFSVYTYIRPDDLLWALVMVSWIINIKKVQRISLKSLPLFGVIVVLLIVAMLSGFRVFVLSPYAMPIGNYFWFLLRLFQYVSVYFIVGTADFSDKERNALFSLMILTGAVVAAISFLQFMGVLETFPRMPHIGDPGTITATFSFKTEFGAIAMILILLVIDKMIRQKWNWLLGFLLLGCFTLMLLISQSRSAWVACVIGISVYMLTIRSFKTKIIWSMVLIIAGILFMGFQGNIQLYNSHPIIDLETGRLSKDEAVSARLTSHPVIIKYLSTRPDIILLGVGLMNWRYTLTPISRIYGGHNNYLTALVELGLFGLLAFGFLLLQGFLSARKAMKLNQPYSQFYLSVLAGLCAACLFEDIFWPAVAQESFLAFFMFVSALSLPSGFKYSEKIDEIQG